MQSERRPTASGSRVPAGSSVGILSRIVAKRPVVFLSVLALRPTSSFIKAPPNGDLASIFPTRCSVTAKALPIWPDCVELCALSSTATCRGFMSFWKGPSGSWDPPAPRPNPSSGALISTLPGPVEGSSILNVHLVVASAAVFVLPRALLVITLKRFNIHSFQRPTFCRTGLSACRPLHV